MGHVVIGMDPHKRSATIEIIDDRGKVLCQGRFGTDRDGYKAMLAAGRKFADRTWAVEGCNGIGRHVAQRLVAGSEPVAGVPAKLSARARLFSTGQGRKSDPFRLLCPFCQFLARPGLAAHLGARRRPRRRVRFCRSCRAGDRA
jgi:transposase